MPLAFEPPGPPDGCRYTRPALGGAALAPGKRTVVGAAIQGIHCQEFEARYWNGAAEDIKQEIPGPRDRWIHRGFVEAAVVTREEHDRIFKHAFRFEGIEDPSNLTIHLVDHGGVKATANILYAEIAIDRIDGCLVRQVRRIEGNVKESRSRPVAFSNQL